PQPRRPRQARPHRHGPCRRPSVDSGRAGRAQGKDKDRTDKLLSKSRCELELFGIFHSCSSNKNCCLNLWRKKDRIYGSLRWPGAVVCPARREFADIRRDEKGAETPGETASGSL